MTVAKITAPKNVIIAAVPSWHNSGSDEAATPSAVDTAAGRGCLVVDDGTSQRIGWGDRGRRLSALPLLDPEEDRIYGHRTATQFRRPRLESPV
jgi:hypothetical protein